MKEHTRRLAVLLISVLVVIGAPVAVHNFGDSDLDTEGYSPIGLAQAAVFNISDTTHLQDVEPPDGTKYEPRGLAWNDDGTRLFLIGVDNIIVEFSVDTAYNLSGLSATGNEFDISGFTTTAEGLAFSSDGTKMYVADDENDEIEEFALSTGFDITTASHSTNVSISTQDTSPRGIAIGDSDSKLYIAGNSADSIHEYTMSTPADLSTVSFTQSQDISTEHTTPTAVIWNNDGTKMFMVGNEFENDHIFQYSASTAWDVSSISLTTSLDIGGTSSAGDADTGVETNSPESMIWNDDGSKYYIGSNVDETNTVNNEIVEARVADTSSGGGGATATPTPDGYYVQPIGLISKDEEFFNPQLSDIKAYVYVDDNGTRLSKITGDGEWAPETSDQFHSPNNYAFLNLVDGKAYKFVVEDHLGNVVHRVGWVADRHPDGCVVDCSAYVIVVRGPTGGGEAGGDGETDGSGTFTTAPDLNQTDYKLPEQEAYLQTGIFYFLDEGRCVGLRYWDPNYETTSISYNFTAQGTTYSDTIDTGSEVGYFEACLDPLGVEGGSELPDTGLEDLEGEIVFEGFQNGSAFGGAFGLNDFGSSLNESGGFFGPAGAGGGGGGEGNIPWWWWLGVVILGYVFRDEIGQNAKRISRGLGR